MKVKARNHVYETLPPFMNNRTLPRELWAERIIVGLTVATMPEQDAYQREIAAIRSDYALDKAQELIEEKAQEFMHKHFAWIKGLEIEGLAGELDYDTFYREAPPEIVAWVGRAITSTTELSLAERKNFEPESDSAS